MGSCVCLGFHFFWCFFFFSLWCRGKRTRSWFSRSIKLRLCRLADTSWLYISINSPGKSVDFHLSLYLSARFRLRHVRCDVLKAKRLPDRAEPVMRPPAPTANNLGGIVDYSLPRVRSISQLHNSIIPPKLSQRNTLLLHHPPAFIRLTSLSLEIGL